MACVLKFRKSEKHPFAGRLLLGGFGGFIANQGFEVGTTVADARHGRCRWAPPKPLPWADDGMSRLKRSGDLPESGVPFYLAAAIESTLIIFALASRVPMTRTFSPANFSGVFWSLNP